MRSRPITILIALLAAVCAGGGCLAAPAAASKRATVTGRLSARGYTIVAVGFNGKVSTSKAQKFTLVLPDSKYTLQLLNRRGVYAGPVVVGGSGSKVIVGLTGPVKLGKVEVNSARGFARLAKPVAKHSLVRSRWAWARGGVPLGNGRNLGLVVSPTKGTGPSGPGGDSDRSGIPNMFDVASDGRRIINALLPRSEFRAMLAQHAADGPPSVNPSGPAVSWMSQMFLPIDQTINADATGVSQSDIDAAMQSNLNLKLLGLPLASSLSATDTIELNCNGLAYCSPGGTGQAVEEGVPFPPGGNFQTVPFPQATLDPQTGFGEVIGPQVPNGMLGTNGGLSSEFSLDPRATSAQIGSGDVITEVSNVGGVLTQTPVTIGFVFETVPAIASYADSAGNSGHVSYPDTTGLGTMNNPFRLAAGPDGNVLFTLNVYRPQRAGVAGAGEPAYMDIGHLSYAADYVPNLPNNNNQGGVHYPACNAGDYTSTSPTLSVQDSGAGGQLVDSAPDQPASPSNTISFTLNLSQCAAEKGAPLQVGQPIMLDISATSQSSSDHANQTFWVERTS